MSTPDLFRWFFLREDESTFIYVDSGGSIQETTDFAIGVANPLKYGPNNWEDIEQSWERSTDLHGVFTKVSGEYTFNNDAAQILRYIIFTYGYTAKLILRTDIRQNNNWIYSVYQMSTISFEKPRIDMDTVAIQLFEEGIAQDLKTNLNTPYEIPIDGGLQVYFAGTRIRGKYYWLYANVRSQSSIVDITINEGEYVTLLLARGNSEGLLPVAVQQTQEVNRMGNTANQTFYDDNAYSKYFWSSVDNQVISCIFTHPACRIRWKYESGGVAPTSITAQFYYYLIVAAANDNFAFRSPIYAGPVITATSGTYYFEDIPLYNGSFDINPGERIFLCAVVINSTSAPGGGFFINMEDPTNVKPILTTSSNTSPSYINGKRLPVMWKDLIISMSEGKYGPNPAADSFLDDPNIRLIDNYPYHTLVCNALHLKGVNDAIFKMTLGDFINHLKALYPIGIGVKDGQIALGTLGQFHDDSNVIFDAGIFTDWSIEPTDDMANVLQFGYNYDDGDVVNGRDAFNTMSAFKSNGKFSSDKELDMTSPYISDIQSIEKQRVDEAGKDTTGNKINDQIFCFSVYKDNLGGDYFLNYPNQMGGVVSGVFYPDWAYNVDLSPRRNAERLRFLINSITYPSIEPIKFQSSDRNADMVSKFPDGGGGYYPEIVEKADIVPDNFDILWLPFKFKAKCRTPIDLPLLMKNNPYGVVIGKINIDGKTADVRIFVDSISFKPADRESFDIEGRLSPSVNLDNLK